MIPLQVHKAGSQHPLVLLQSGTINAVVASNNAIHEPYDPLITFTESIRASSTSPPQAYKVSFVGLRYAGSRINATIIRFARSLVRLYFQSLQRETVPAVACKQGIAVILLSRCSYLPSPLVPPACPGHLLRLNPRARLSPPFCFVGTPGSFLTGKRKLSAGSPTNALCLRLGAGPLAFRSSALTKSNPPALG